MEIVDQIGQKLKLSSRPKRIVSLVPSQTELLYSLGLEQEVIGITKFCVHPAEWFRVKQRVGGTKNVNLEVVDTLMPDLVLANKEENTKADVEAIAKKHPVWTSDISNLNQALHMITEVGAITRRTTKASRLRETIELSFERLAKVEARTVLYLIWKDPYMSVGEDTFIHDMLTRMGLCNVVGDRKRYPAVSASEMIQLNPSKVFLSSEPYPFKEKHIADIQNLLPNATVVLVDGEMFSWYGSRLQYSATYFQNLLTKMLP